MPRSLSRALIAAVALLAASPAGLAGQGVAPVSAAAAPRFATATVVDPTNLYGEPDLRSDPARPGQWYASGPWGTGTQRSIWNRSTDGAHTFREMHDHPDTVHTGGSLEPPGGGDTEIALDHKGNMFLADLAALQTQKVYRSADGGKTFSSQALPPVFQDNQGTDRQWIGVWDPPAGTPLRSAYRGPFPVAYMTYLTAGLASTVSGEAVATSLPAANGDDSQVGLNYSCGTGAIGSASCPRFDVYGDGYTTVDQPTGKVIQALDRQPTGAAHHELGIEVTSPDATGYMATTAYTKVAELPGNEAADTIFPVIAMDTARTLYVLWITRVNSDADNIAGHTWQVYYSWAAVNGNDTWTNWSAPIKVSGPPSNTAAMLWAQAGAPGILDIAWYGTDAKLTTVSNESVPAIAGATWTLYFANVTQASTASPQVLTTAPTGIPMHHGSICLDGLGCITETGNRNLADFFELTTDSSGAAYIVFNDTSNDLIQQVPVTEVGLPAGVVDHTGAEVTMVVRQISGTSLNGTQLSLPDDHSIDGIRSGSGDALYDVITGSNQTGLDITGTSLTLQGGNLEAAIQVVDPGSAGAQLAAAGIPFGDYVVRWAYKQHLYFAEAEVVAGAGTSQVTFVDGSVQTVDLCSVSACDPHITTYPGPTVAPLSSHLVTGRVVPASGSTPGAIVIDVPVGDVGSPARGSVLDSVGAYSLGAVTSALLPVPNALAQADIVPQEIDGACCFTPCLGGCSAQPNPVSLPPGALPPSSSGGLSNTGAERAPVLGAAVAAIAGFGVATLVGRRRRRSSNR